MNGDENTPVTNTEVTEPELNPALPEVGAVVPEPTVSTGPAETVFLDEEQITPVSGKDAEGPSIVMAYETQADWIKRDNPFEHPRLAELGDKQRVREPSVEELLWLGAAQEIGGPFYEQQDFENTAARQNAHWSQQVVVDGKQIRPTLRDLNPKGTGRLTGTDAKIAFRKSIGLGRVGMFPMWHSGFWIALKTPTSAAWWELENKLIQEKEQLGRETTGRAYSNSRVYLNQGVVDFIINHIDKAFIESATKEIIVNYLSMFDLGLLANAMAATMYPRGYLLSRPCTADVNNCMHVAKELLNISKLCWYDTANIPEAAKQHMARRNVDHRIETIEQYQENLRKNLPEATYQINEVLSVRFKAPSLAEHLEAGMAWMADISAQMDKTFTKNYSPDERLKGLASSELASRARTYQHFYDEFEISQGEGEEPYIIDQISEISEQLEDLSHTPELIEGLLKAVDAFTEAYPIAMVGLYNYNCPACGSRQSAHEVITDDEGKPTGELLKPLHRIIPVDAVEIFFILAHQKFNQLMGQSAIR